MKNVLILSILAAALGGCAIVPAGYDDNREGYYQERGYNRGDGYYQERGYDRGDGYYGYRDYNRRDWNDHDYNYRREHGNQIDPFREHDR